MAGLTETAGRFLPHPAGPDLSNAGARKAEIEQRAAEQGWPAGEYLKWLREGRGFAAIVSMVEFPSEIQAENLRELPPPFVYSPTGVDTIRGLVAKGAIHTAIVPRAGAGDEKASRNAPAAEVVAARYETLTR